MIDAKSFIEFFEKEYEVTVVDNKTGEKALDIIAKKEKTQSNPYNHTAYKSDYDRFLEEEDGGE
jgi:hypothetical protein